MWRLALLLAICSLPAWGAPARVLSGEHDGFTRLVVELASPSEWTVGRTSDGYALQISGPVNQFDLSEAFDLIGKSRIAALSADPVTGMLNVAIGCNCHVAPFEFRPGTIVLDFKDGPPSDRSAYEALLEPQALPSDAPPTPEPQTKAEENALAFAWVDAALGSSGAGKTAAEKASDSESKGLSEPSEAAGFESLKETAADPGAESAPVSSGEKPDLPLNPLMDVGLAPLRESLMQEISRGAAQGVVGMDLPKDETLQPETAFDEPDQARVGLGDLAALPQVKVEGVEPGDLSPEGAQCPTDVQLDAASWGDDRPVWEQLSEMRSGLVGEFDQPNPEAISKALKFHLFIGFGQEALALMKAMGTEDRDAALWASIAHILDEVPDPAPAFAGMEGCESGAALWAVLSTPGLQNDRVNLDALQRAFSALPTSLRQILGPRLVDRLLAMGETDSVNVISNAIRRAGIDQDRDLTLTEAAIAADAGEFEAADEILEPLLDDPGPKTAEALVAKIEGQAARALPISEVELAQISAFAAERAGGPQNAAFQRALVLAQALTGDFSSAFASAPDDPALQADLWRLLSALGTDDAVLAVAALLPDAPIPEAAHPQAAVMAERFLRLGLPDQAQIWASDAEGLDQILAAEIALANRDGILALSHLQGQTGEPALSMQVAANVLIGNNQAAAADLAKAGDAQGAALVLARARDWVSLGADGPAEWQNAALSVAKAPVQTFEGPLAEGVALADAAQETSTALRALLATVPPVDFPKP